MSDDFDKTNNTEFALLRNEIRKKPGLVLFSVVIAAPFAVLIGLLAIFVPREFDTLQSGIDEAKTAADAAKLASINSNTASSAAQMSAEMTLAEFRGLKTAIAEANARPVLCSTVEFKSFGWIANGFNSEGFKEILPENTYEKLCDSGVAPSFLYSNFDGEDWVFVRQAQFNQLDSDLQTEIEASFQRFDVNLKFLN